MTKIKEKKKRHEFEKRQKIDKEASEEVDHIEQLQRIQAEFENYKKRTDKEKEEHDSYAKSGLIKDLLPVLDSFDLAVKIIENNKDEDTFKGIKMVFDEFKSLLEKQGLKKIEVAGSRLDPFKHEVVMQKESEKEDDMILEEVQTGYMLKDKVLRASKVIVSKKIVSKKLGGK